jgi:hypothetical protein
MCDCEDVLRECLGPKEPEIEEDDGQDQETADRK